MIAPKVLSALLVAAALGLLGCSGAAPSATTAIAPPPPPAPSRCELELADANGRPYTADVACDASWEAERMKGAAARVVDAAGRDVRAGRREGTRHLFAKGSEARRAGIWWRVEEARLFMANRLLRAKEARALPLLPLLFTDTPAAPDDSSSWRLRFVPQTRRLEMVALGDARAEEPVLAPGVAARAYAEAALALTRAPNEDKQGLSDLRRQAGINTRRAWILALAWYVGARLAERPDYADRFNDFPAFRAWPKRVIEADLMRYTGLSPIDSYNPQALAAALFAGLWAARDSLPPHQRPSYDQELFAWFYAPSSPLAQVSPDHLALADSLAASLPIDLRLVLCKEWRTSFSALYPRLGACVFP